MTLVSRRHLSVRQPTGIRLSKKSLKTLSVSYSKIVVVKPLTTDIENLVDNPIQNTFGTS